MYLFPLGLRVLRFIRVLILISSLKDYSSKHAPAGGLFIISDIQLSQFVRLAEQFLKTSALAYIQGL